MEAIKVEPSDESEQLVLSHPYEAKQTIDQLRMTFTATIQRIEVHVKSDSSHKPAKRQLTEEELEARRRINRIRMAATRARRTLEQIEADRMSQRARMAELRRRRSEQEIKSVLGEQGTQEEVDIVEVSRNVSNEPRVRRNSSSRRQLTPEELEIRRRINRLRVAMMRAERTEEQIEAERKAQRLRMAELRRRRSEEQIAADLESQRARMAALRRERRSRLREDGPGGELCTPIVKQEMEEDNPDNQQPPFTPLYADTSQTAQATVGGGVLHSVEDWERKQLAAERRRQWLAKLSPEEIEERKRRAAERMRIYRATLRATLSPQEIQERKWKAAERMRQWRASLTQEELARIRAKGLERARRWRLQRGGREVKTEGEEDSLSVERRESPSCAASEGGSLRWEKAAACATTQDQGSRQCTSFKDCVVSSYFSMPTARDSENGCSAGHWTNSSAPATMADPYVNGSVPVSLSPRSPPPSHFLPHHQQHHHPVSGLPDVSSVVASSEGGPSLGESSPQQPPQPPPLVHMPCLQPPHIPLSSGLGPPFAPRSSLACDWPQPRQHLMGYEGFSAPLHAAAIAATRPLEES